MSLQVSIVGLITGKFRGESCNLLTVYDGTGTIEVKQFTDHENDDLQVCDEAVLGPNAVRCSVVIENVQLRKSNVQLRVYNNVGNLCNGGSDSASRTNNAFLLKSVSSMCTIVYFTFTGLWKQV